MLKLLLSIIVPVYREGESVYTAHAEITRSLAEQLPNLEYELIFVDDGSRDESFVHIARICESDRRVRGIQLSSNVGSHMAIRAGIEHAKGDCACFIACDLQEPPALIPRMLDALRDQIQIVWAVRNTRHDSLQSRMFAAGFYFFARLLVSKDIPPAGASMFLLGSTAL